MGHHSTSLILWGTGIDSALGLAHLWQGVKHYPKGNALSILRCLLELYQQPFLIWSPWCIMYQQAVLTLHQEQRLPSAL